MTRLVEIFVGVNALLGIAAFLSARAIGRRMKGKAEELLRLDDGPKEES